MNYSRSSSFISTRLVRAVAILFLVYSGVEITFPQFCAEAAGGVGIATRVASHADETASVTAGDSQNELPAEEPCADEDCFCCCSHIVPGRATATIGTSDAGPDSLDQSLSHLPSPPLRSPYHPPRQA